MEILTIFLIVYFMTVLGMLIFSIYAVSHDYRLGCELTVLHLLILIFVTFMPFFNSYVGFRMLLDLLDDMTNNVVARGKRK